MPLDESLITSDVCIKCGSCCKMTTDPIRCSDFGFPWYKTVVEQNDLIKLVNFDSNKNQVQIRFRCPKLDVDEKENTYKCSIYADRPAVCSNYNCFKDANNKNRRPENWDRIKVIVKQVHGVDLTWDGPMRRVTP